MTLLCFYITNVASDNLVTHVIFIMQN